MGNQGKNKQHKNFEAVIKSRVNASNISCSSMVVAVFGDVISMHGGWVWLGSLIEALEPLGYSDRLTRTAVNRLLQNDWLKSKQVGRKSFYCIGESSKGIYEKAGRRIYADGPQEWDGSWILVIPSQVPEEKKEELRKSLLWQGFNSLVNGMYAHPSSDTTPLDETLCEQELLNDVVVMTAKTTNPQSQKAIKQLVENRWGLEELESAYSDFFNFYRPFGDESYLASLSQRDQFLLRILLIHEFRRILLKDPDFPEQMLPLGWIGREVQQLVKRIYMALSPGSIRYICGSFENVHGQITKPSSEYYKRFGGLEKTG